MIMIRRVLGKCRGVQDHRPSSEPRGETGGAQKTRSRFCRRHYIIIVLLSLYYHPTPRITLSDGHCIHFYPMNVKSGPGVHSKFRHQIFRSFPRTFEAPHSKDESVRTIKGKRGNIKFFGIAFALLLVIIHLAIFVWEEVKLPGSTGSLLTEPFWYLWNILF